jgi:hypothetical protein
MMGRRERGGGRRERRSDEGSRRAHKSCSNTEEKENLQGTPEIVR